MLWVLYALLSGFFFSTADAFTKKVSDKVDDHILVLSRFMFGVPLLLLLFIIPIPVIGTAFWYAFAVLIPIEALSYTLYIKSIKSSPISLVLPFLSFTPVFLLLTSFLILGEFPNVMGLVGILIIVIGAYVLHLKSLKHGMLDPIKSIISNRGSMYMLIVAFFFSITSTLSKIIVLNSSPFFAVIVYLSSLSVVLFFIALVLSGKKIFQLKTEFKSLFPIGLFYSLMALFHNMAITLAIVPFIMSIKRSSSLFSVFYGHFWFKEKNIKARFAGAVIMVVGASLIIIS
ncbi:DMT family transporter [archaeon]|nr:DMT family transporter [archaeon]